MVTRRGLFGRVAAALAIAPVAPKLIADLLPARFDPENLTLDGKPIDECLVEARISECGYIRLPKSAALHEVRFYDDVGEFVANPVFCRVNVNAYVDKFTLCMLSPRVTIVGHLVPNGFSMSRTVVNLPSVKRGWVDNMAINVQCNTARVMIDHLSCI